MNYKPYFMLIFSLSLAGCIILPAVIMHEKQEVSNKTEILDFDPKTQSRIRIYYDNVNINSYENMQCHDWNKRKLKNYFTSLSTSLSNRQNLSIGIPQTKKSFSLSNLVQKGLGPKISFKEFLYQANQPIVFDAHHVNVNYSCHVAASLTLKPGLNYELNFSMDNATRSCSLNLAEITQTQVEQLYTVQKSKELIQCH